MAHKDGVGAEVMKECRDKIILEHFKERSEVIKQDDVFSKEYLEGVADKVWGDLWR